MDKYLIIALSLVFLFGMFYVFSGDEYTSENSMVGIAYDIHSSSNGYVFRFDSSEETGIRCFSKEPLENYGLYRISGSYSSDSSMYFVSSVQQLRGRIIFEPYGHPLNPTCVCNVHVRRGR